MWNGRTSAACAHVFIFFFCFVLFCQKKREQNKGFVLFFLAGCGVGAMV
jgi:hypothetical protein